MPARMSARMSVGTPEPGHGFFEATAENKRRGSVSSLPEHIPAGCFYAMNETAGGYHCRHLYQTDHRAKEEPAMKEMTSLERVNAVMKGELPDRIPVIPQCFMFSAMEYGYHIGEINRDPAKLAAAHIACQDKYGYDGCVIDIDDATLAEACGAKVIFRDEGVAAVDEKHPLLESLEDIDELELPDPLKSGRCCEWLETTQRLVEAIGDHVFIMGRADQGPFDVLTLLRGPEDFMCDLLTEDPEVIQHALEWATEAHLRFARAQFAAGAHATSMGDSYAGQNLISPQMYREFAFPHEKAVVDGLAGRDGYYSIHICGKANDIIADMGRTGADILEIDYATDMGFARKMVPDNVVLMGNIDPSGQLVLGSPADVDAKAKEIIESTRGRGIILSSGCAMGENTRPENMRAMIDAAKKYGSYELLCAMQEQS